MLGLLATLALLATVCGSPAGGTAPLVGPDAAPDAAAATAAVPVAPVHAAPIDAPRHVLEVDAQVRRAAQRSCRDQ
jgi:hypothetical protein